MAGRADFSEPGGPGFDSSSRPFLFARWRYSDLALSLGQNAYRQPQVVALIGIENPEFLRITPLIVG